jgi:two-component system, response regulator
MKTRVILLVEDNPGDVELTKRALKETNILIDLVVAQDGQEALDYLFGTGQYAGRDTSDLPLIVLLDLKLPGMHGIEVLQHIREDARTTLLPVVILTSSKEEEDVIQSYQGRANSYIRKPVDFERFVEAMRTLGVYWVALNEPLPE